jgi:uncharacterized membrane protein YebE (DUF533 family)
MFDAKSLFDMLIKGAGQAPQSQGAAGGGLGDLLGQLGAAMGQQQSRPGAGPAAGGGGLGDLLGQLGAAMGQQQGRPGVGPQGGGGGLGDILGQIGGAMGQQSARPGMAPPAGGQPTQGGGGLGDILGQLQDMMRKGQGAGGAQAPQGGAGGGGLMDILGQVLGQATQGVKEGAQRIDQTTGASGHARDAVGRATGKSPEELLEQLKELVQNNKLGAGAAAGGLGAVVLGTKTGRSIAAQAVKLGGLALIGGLAYKALQNYQQGKPLLGSRGGDTLALTEAPQGSGFETGAVTNEAAMLYIRGMIAAAAADGRIDAAEQQKLIGGLRQAGLDAQAEEFLANELNNPASAADLASAVQTQEEAVQLFTAARIAIDLDTQEEHDFLVGLAQLLELEGQLVAHIDAAARTAG